MREKLLAGAAVAIAFVVVWLTPSHANEAQQEWVIAQAILEDVDPHQTLAGMARDLGWVPLGDFEVLSPRTPGALVLGMPWALVDHGSLSLVSRLAVAVLALPVAWMTARLVRTEFWRVAIWLPLFFLWAGGAALAVTGGSEMLVAASVLGTFLLGRRGDAWLAGAPLAVAVSLKLWPGLLLLVLWASGRRRMAIGAAAATLLLNAAGLVLPGVSLAGSVRTLRAGPGFIDLPVNGSVWATGWGPVLAGLLVVAAIWHARRGWEAGYMLAVPVGILAAPLAWTTYLVTAAIPVVWSRSKWGLAFAALGFAWMVGVEPAPIVTISLVVAAAAVLCRQDRGDVATPVSRWPEPSPEARVSTR